MNRRQFLKGTSSLVAAAALPLPAAPVNTAQAKTLCAVVSPGMHDDLIHAKNKIYELYWMSENSKEGQLKKWHGFEFTQACEGGQTIKWPEELVFDGDIT